MRSIIASPKINCKYQFQIRNTIENGQKHINKGMKLYELVKRRKKLSLKLPNLKHIEKIGQGAEASVFSTKSPNSIIKVIPLKNLDSSYLEFIDAIMDHQDNPYFPKIHKAVVHNTLKGPVLILSMEKLHKLNDPKLQDSIKHLFSSIFGISPEQWEESLYSFHKGHLSFSDLGHLAMIGGYDSVKDMLTQTKDPKLIEAYQILAPLIAKYGDDLHNDNIMVRLTGTGPQLVLVDPLRPSI